MRLPHQCHCSITEERENQPLTHNLIILLSNYFTALHHQPTDFHQIRHKFMFFVVKAEMIFSHLPSRKKRNSTRECTNHVLGGGACIGLQ